MSSPLPWTPKKRTLEKELEQPTPAKRQRIKETDWDRTCKLDLKVKSVSHLLAAPTAKPDIRVLGQTNERQATELEALLERVEMLKAVEYVARLEAEEQDRPSFPPKLLNDADGVDKGVKDLRSTKTNPGRHVMQSVAFEETTKNDDPVSGQLASEHAAQVQVSRKRKKETRPVAMQRSYGSHDPMLPK